MKKFFGEADMIYSMTGYGAGRSKKEEYDFTVEIKTVNNRYSDINVHGSIKLLFLEDEIKKIINKSVSRGKIDVFINMNSKRICPQNLYLNEDLAQKYVTVLKRIGDIFDCHDALKTSDIANFSDVITLEDAELDKTPIRDAVIEATETAVKNLMHMRSVEGERLKADILEKTERLKNCISEIEELSYGVEEEYRQGLIEKMRLILSKFGQDVDQQRIVQEAAIVADKTSIDEEIVRFKSHVLQIGEILEQNFPVGRKLDFLIQETNREINTIGSKTVKLEIVNCVVIIKSELEKIREQIQNIE